MRNYPATKIRNVVLLGHGRSGKTALAEAMLYNAKAIDRLGKAADGNTTMDFDPEEIKRQASINTSIAAIEWMEHKINIIDTPGDFDYMGEVMQGLRVADGAVITVSAKSGVSVGTEKSMRFAGKQKIPVFFYVSKIDEPNASFDRTLEQLTEHFGNTVTPFVLPIVEETEIKGFVNVFTNTAYKNAGKKLEEIPVPANMADRVSGILESIKEHAAESDEELMEKFFNGEEFTQEELVRGLAASVVSGSLKPVFGGSSTINLGVDFVMNSIARFMPSPVDSAEFAAKDGDGNEITLKASESETLSAIVFKTIVDPFVGKISIFKVCSGVMHSNSTVYNSDKEKDERVAGIFTMCGKKQVAADLITAGDIGAVTKLSLTNTNDTLCDKARPVILKKIVFPIPCLTMAIIPKAKGEEDKIAAGLSKLAEEDPTFSFNNNAETHQMTVSGMGEQHIDVLRSKLKAKFNVESTLEAPKVAYRETIRKKVKVQGKHKKQSGGHGQYGDVWIEFEPGETTELTFEEKIFGGSVPKSYHPAVEKGLQDAIVKGVLAGYPVVNLKATLVDGSYHDVDSNELSFRMAARLAYKAGLPKADPILLEPISSVNVSIPDSYLGDIMGDMNKRRGRIMGITPDGDQQIVSAEVPTSEMASYATDLRSMTQGRGWYTIEFARY
ncbi:elongation factor G, partial [Candidatus Nomurabacteria bacterium]|nr:elongation factor G [Candidatus Nomurabacteria bacterium]